MNTEPAIVELTADDIQWALSPLVVEPSDEDPDPLVASMLETMSYRLLAQESMHALGAMTKAYDQLESRHHRSLNEIRRLRGAA